MSEEREGSADGPEAPPPPPPLPPPRPEPEDDGLTERPYLVWIDGLPVSKDFNFHTEYVAPCQAAYPQDFLQRKSFLCDRHDLWDAPVPAGAQPPLTWGVLAFRTLESAKECGMKAAAGPLIAESDSMLKQPPARVTVRRRIPAPQEEVDAMAEELRRQASINAGSLVRGAIAAAEQRWAAGELQLNALLAEEREPSPPPPPPPPPPPEAEADEAADEAAAQSPAGPGAAGADDMDLEDRFFFQSSKRPTAPAAQQKQQEDEAAAAPPPPPLEEQQPPLPKEPQKQQEEEEEEAPPLPPPEEQQPPLPEEAQRRLAPIVTRPQPTGKHARQHAQQASSPRLASPRVSSPRVASPRLTSPRGGGASKAAAAQQQAAHPPDDKKRDKVRGMLTSALSLALKEAAGAGLEPSAAAAAAEAVEAALLKAHGTTSKEYAERARTLTYNLKVPANAELRGHVLKHEIAAHVFVHMTSEQLASKDLQRWRQNVRQESLRQAVLPPEIAAQISTAAAVQMRKEGRLGGRGASALLANHSSQAPEDQPLEEAAVAAAHALAPGSPYEAPAVSPVAGAAAAAASEQPLSPATALGSADVAAAAEGAGGAAAGWQPPPPVRTMPTYRLATVSPAASGEHGGSPTAAATAGLWDDAELGLHADEAAGEPGGTPDVHPPQQQQGAAEEEEEQQRSPTPDVEPLPAAGAGQQALPPPLQQPEEEEGREPTPDVDESADEAEEGGTPDAAAGAARQQQAAQPPPQQQREEAGEQRQLSSGGAGAAGTPSAQPQRSRGSKEDERRRERGSAGKSGRGRDGKDPLSPKQRGRSRSRERRGSRHGSREKRRGSEGVREERPERRAAAREDEGRDGRSRKDDGGSKRRGREEEDERRRKDARRAEEKWKGEAGRHDSKKREEGSRRREEGGKRDSKKREGGSRHDSKRRERNDAGKRQEGNRHERERRSSKEGGQEGRQGRGERGSSPCKSRSHSKHRSPVCSPGKRGGERPQRKRSRSPRKRGSLDDYWQALSKRSRQEQAPPAQQQQQQQQQQQGAGQPASGGVDELDVFLEELEQGGSPQLPPHVAGGWEALLADEPEGSGHGTPDVDDGGEPGGTPDLQPPAGQQEQEQQLVPQLSGGWGGGGPVTAEPYPRPISAGWTYNDEQQQYVAGHQQQPHLHWGEQQGRPHGGHSQQHLRGYEGHGLQPGEQPLQQQQWQAGQQWQGGPHDWQQPGWQQQTQPPPQQQGWHDQQLHEWQQPHGEWQPPDHGWWQGELDWPQGSDPSLLLTAAAVQWTNANSGLEPPRLPGRLPVQSTMDGSSLMPLLEGLGVKPGKVCWFLLTLREGERLAAAPALQAGKVGCCLVDLEGHDLLEAEAWTHGREHRGWMLHFMAPTREITFYAGVHRADVEVLGPGALLVLALPVWHGWFYHSAANHAQRDPLAAIRMLGSPLVHQLGPALVAHHRMHTSLPQFQQHREELVDQRLLVKARRAPPDQQALAKCCQNLRHAAKCYAVSLGNVAEMLLMPCRDGRHLQAAVWQPDMGPNRDRIVFDPWTLRIR